MSLDQQVRLAIDHGGATNAVALLARVDGRWRLLGSLALPAAVPVDVIVRALAGRLRVAEPRLAVELDADRAAVTWPRLVARTGRPPRLAVLAPTERTRDRLVAAASRAGWAVLAMSAAEADPLEMSRIVLRRDVTAVLVGASDPPGSDERSVLADLAGLVAAAALRRPDLAVVLSGSLVDHAGLFEAAVPVAPEGRQPGSEEASEQASRRATSDLTGVAVQASAEGSPGAGDGPAVEGSPGRPASDATAVRTGESTAGPPGSTGLLLAPAPDAGDPPGEALRVLLDDLRTTPDDGRRAIARATGTLAEHLERRVEVVEIGHDAGLRAVARPAAAGASAQVRWATVASAALIPDPVDDAAVDGVLAWSTLPLDRYRLRDRLAELRLQPWAEPHGDGAPLRLAAARAALGRLVAATPDLDRPVPDLTVVAGGAWAVAPGPAVGLALADVLRRPGATQLAYDHARLLGPLGTVADPDERRALMADLADDLLAPLGTVVIPGGLRAGKSAGRLVVHAVTGATQLDLVPGGLELVDLPPGESALAEFRFKDTVTLGTRGRHFAIDVGGGLGGLLVDLRDVPLHLPERADRRRELLGAWQRAFWTGLDE